MTILFCETCRTSYHTRELPDGTIEEYCLTCQLQQQVARAKLEAWDEVSVILEGVAFNFGAHRQLHALRAKWAKAGSE